MNTCVPSGSIQPEPLTVMVVPTGPEDGLLSTLALTVALDACAGKIKCSAIKSNAARHDIMLATKRTTLVNLAPCFITNSLTTCFGVRKHLKAAIALALYIPHSPSVVEEEFLSQEEG